MRKLKKVAITCENYSKSYPNISEDIAMSFEQSNLDLQSKKLKEISPQLGEEIRGADEELSTLKKIVDEEITILLEEVKRENKKLERERKRLKKVKK